MMNNLRLLAVVLSIGDVRDARNYTRDLNYFKKRIARAISLRASDAVIVYGCATTGASINAFNKLYPMATKNFSSLPLPVSLSSREYIFFYHHIFRA